MTPLPGDPLAGPDLDRFSRAAFTTVQFREGYTKRQVDDFVERAVQSLRSAVPAMRPEDVRAVRFAPVRMQQGYDMAEVDAYLDDLEQHLAELASRQPPQPDPVEADPDPAGTPWTTRLRTSALSTWQEASLSGRIGVLSVTLGVTIGLLVGLWPGEPSTRTGVLYGVIFSVAVAGVVVVVLQVFLVGRSVVQGVAYLARHAVRRVRGRAGTDDGKA